MPERTLADAPDLMRELRVFKDAPFDPSRRATEVLAPCCDRRCPADCVLDVRGVPGTVVRGGGYQDPKDHDWLCDGCRDRLTRTTAWKPSALFALAGASPVMVKSLKIRERINELEKEAASAGLPFKPADAERVALQELTSV